LKLWGEYPIGYFFRMNRAIADAIQNHATR
jgi:hypothetical protein